MRNWKECCDSLYSGVGNFSRKNIIPAFVLQMTNISRVYFVEYQDTKIIVIFSIDAKTYMIVLKPT